MLIAVPALPSTTKKFPQHVKALLSTATTSKIQGKYAPIHHNIARAGSKNNLFFGTDENYPHSLWTPQKSTEKKTRSQIWAFSVDSSLKVFM